ncbi:MAG: TetR/AcrR family transcriptional regulator [Planctomycetota bacterium]|jgi:AcrR family transcriptional regulator
MDSHRADQVFETEPAVGRGARDTYEERRNHILRSATLLFAQRGYAKASMRMIARGAGVSLAGLYHYYESKEQILFVMQCRVFSSLLTNLREKLYGVEDPAARLRVMIQEHIAYFAANMAELKVCSHELDSLGGDAYDQTRGIRREYYIVVRSIIGDIVEAHRPDFPLDLHVATMALFGTLNWLYRWWHPRGAGSPRTLATQIANQFLCGLSAAPADGDAAPEPQRV